MRKVCVVGAGVMGSGIAQVFAQAGYDVVIVDVAEQFLQKGTSSIRANLERAVVKGKMSKEEAEAVLGRIKTTLDLEKAGGEADFVVEAVVEKMNVKREVFSRLDRACKSHTILASNTSTLSITEMASVTQRPDRVAGMHFFNPAPIMRLVEVIAGAETSQETLDTVKALAEKLGKTPVEVKESPGFVVNRLLTLMLNEACFLLMENVARPEDIDTAMKLGCNHPMGPFELMDLVGLDIVLSITETLYQETGDPKFRPSPLLRKMVRAGLLGRKTGQGFYTYKK
ncbi:TPA: 3-hydroxybutyryl-CoA dehydrogenase [Candidatus Bathyarchaeota archaeon]|nr:3-hydroxybutyryl-CoA dehydrogenase [Candidatus Bathyarchaeota archaeon]